MFVAASMPKLIRQKRVLTTIIVHCVKAHRIAALIQFCLGVVRVVQKIDEAAAASHLRPVSLRVQGAVDRVEVGSGCQASVVCGQGWQAVTERVVGY
eukprot:scaffold637177_cov27-Prasinocladus_malaysianus.AAC.1